MRYLIKFSYDGSKFMGYQKQNDVLTVQGRLEELLSKRFNRKIKIYASGRTDRGVHAINQYAHFDAIESDVNKLTFYLNEQLDGIYIKSISVVDENFNARFSASKKIYKYVINTLEYDVFKRNYELQYCKVIDLEKINEIILLLKGVHDFENFTTIQDKKESYVREIYDIKVVDEKGRVSIYVSGSGFLRYMVRNIIGLLLSYSEGKITITDVEKILNNETSNKPVKVSGVGLYLYDVIY